MKRFVKLLVIRLSSTKSWKICISWYISQKSFHQLHYNLLEGISDQFHVENSNLIRLTSNNWLLTDPPCEDASPFILGILVDK